MKITILIASLMLTTTVASATEAKPKGIQNNSEASAEASASAHATAAAAAFGGSATAYGGTGGSGGVGGNATGGSVNFEQNAERPAASSAFAPPVGTSNDCQIATPQSRGFSVLIASASWTASVDYNDLCYAYKRGQFDVADKLMCKKSKDYAEANPTVCQ